MKIIKVDGIKMYILRYHPLKKIFFYQILLNELIDFESLVCFANILIHYALFENASFLLSFQYFIINPIKY